MSDPGGYTGPASVTVDGRGPAQLGVQLVGHFDPIAGRFTWQGRIRGLAAVEGDPVAEGTPVRIETPYGVGEGTLSAQDAFGGHIVTGTGAPPFAQLPDDDLEG
ncbi:DUF4873 domain-containing protein [Williamsia deligens]|uniref:DUF4873 domain-containing protein n=1 Tax=Williamsia deligens TaxID=321325 RepID=A0ABW3G7D4_9NOCA|nr:DUF4873 domain-containing protein [Williamsia deligens]MCP2193109.1 protein of unknown function (DUF4873) [Williamsia deligens]